MMDINSRNVGIFVLIATVVSYFLPLIQDNYKNYFVIFGLILFTGIIMTPKAENILTRYLLREKNFRYLSLYETATIDEHGNCSIFLSYEILNEGQPMQRFPHRIYFDLADINKTLEALNEEGKFEIKALDGHNLRWEKIEDTGKNKEISIIFDSVLKPGDIRKFSVRYQLEKLFKTKIQDMPEENKYESASFSPLYICDKFRLKVKFHPNYKYSNPRYCVRGPSKEELKANCQDLVPAHDIESGGTFVKIEQHNPWRNHEYAIEWYPAN